MATKLMLWHTDKVDIELPYKSLAIKYTYQGTPLINQSLNIQNV